MRKDASNAMSCNVTPSQALRDVPEYPFARWAEQCRAVSSSDFDVIRLDIGNPDLPPPSAVVDAMCEAVRLPNAHRYPGYRGTEAFREAVCRYYQHRFAVSLEAETQVTTLLGSKEGIVHLQRALLDPGDLVLVPDPGYTPYDAGARMAGAAVARFPLTRDGLPDFAAIPARVARQAKLLWLNYPNNPTAAVAGRRELEQAVAFALKHDLLLCHDAPYVDVRFGDCRPLSILEIPGASDVAVEFNSLSKTYNMPGWRIGYAVGNREALRLLRQVKSNIDSGMFLPLQSAAIAALSIDASWIDKRNTVYKERLDLLASSFTKAGVSATAPLATHYLWIPTPSAEPAEAFATRLLVETGIAIAPGTFFGPGGEGFIRVSATAPTEQIQEAARRLSSWHKT
jgi:LL-diaminopimelate aminotransferase